MARSAVALGLLLAQLVPATGFTLPSRGIRRPLRRHAQGLPSEGVAKRVKTKQNERSDQELKEGIAKFYDESSGLWLEIWGDDMHHGYYPLGEKRPTHREAQVQMIERTLEWANVDAMADAQPALRVLDAGCGAGGSSRHMARKYSGAVVTGITLSPVQQAAATDLTAAEGLETRVDFKVADAMATPFEDNTFDVVWSMESGEHMPDKDKFIQEMYRIAKPGGRIIVVTWCTRDGELEEREHRLLRKINRAYYLPEWVSVERYLNIFHSLGLKNVKTEDWTDNIAPFWPAVIRSTLRPKRFWKLVRVGRRTFRGAVAMVLMIRGYNKGTIKFGLIQGTKGE